MRIGELADRAGTTAQTIRYYESIGLLPGAERLPSGYRTYTDADVSRVAFVRAAQRLGLALEEIGEILRFRERGEPPCAYVLDALDRQVADLDRRISEMTTLREELRTLNATADRLPKDGGGFCALIERHRHK